MDRRVIFCYPRRLRGVVAVRLIAFWTFFVVLSWPVLAWPPTWGRELTFTDDVMEKANHGPTGLWPKSRQNQAALEHFHEVAKEELKGRPDVKSVQFLEEEDKWGNDVVRVQYTDGWSFDVTLDPYSLEVIPHYGLLTDIEKQLDREQKDIFGLMAKAGYRPRRNVGGGHLHFGMESAFGDDVILAANWLADQANESHLAWGSMETDFANAMPFAWGLSKRQKIQFEKVLEAVRRREIKTPRSLFTRFYAEVMFDGKPATGKRIMASKYFQFNGLRMAYLDTWETLVPDKNGEFNTWADYEAVVLYDEVPKKLRTGEIRHLTTPRTALEAVENIRLFQGRLDFLRDRIEVMRLNPQFFTRRKPTPQEGARAFYRYVLQSRQKPEVYRSRLPQPEDGNEDWAAWQAEYERVLEDPCRAGLETFGR